MYDILRQKSVQATGVVTRDADDDDGEEETYIKVPISSTGVDRDGDEFSEEGLKDLRDQIRETPRPVYENHGFSGDKGIWDAVRYDWKDIIGSLDDADIETESGVDVLYGYIQPNPQNERGEQLTGYVKAGMPVGFSIGFGIGNADEKDAGGLAIHSSDLMELSAVGIQSNRESVATNAADTAVAMVKGAGGLDHLDLDEQMLAKAMVDEMLDPEARDDAKHNDPTEWAKKRFPDADGQETPSATNTNDMGNEDDTTDADDDLMKRVVDLQERQADQIDEANESIEKLNDRLDDLETRTDEDEEEEEDDDEDDEDDDEKSFSVTVTSKNEEAIAKLKDAAEDDELDLDESKTTVAVRDADDVGTDADDNTGKAVF